MEKMSKNKMTAMSGVFIALALILSYLESLIPLNFAVPGIKLGLANIVTIVALYKLGLKLAVFISLGRIILAGILFGNVTIIIYSLAGAALSIIVMCLVKKIKIFSVAGVSICGAVAHNCGQIIVAALVMENINILYYMLILCVTGAVSGVLIGALAAVLLKNIDI